MSVDSDAHCWHSLHSRLPQIAGDIMGEQTVRVAGKCPETGPWKMGFKMQGPRTDDTREKSVALRPLATMIFRPECETPGENNKCPCFLTRASAASLFRPVSCPAHAICLPAPSDGGRGHLPLQFLDFGSQILPLLDSPLQRGWRPCTSPRGDCTRPRVPVRGCPRTASAVPRWWT